MAYAGDELRRFQAAQDASGVNTRPPDPNYTMPAPEGYGPLPPKPTQVAADTHPIGQLVNRFGAPSGATPFAGIVPSYNAPTIAVTPPPRADARAARESGPIASAAAVGPQPSGYGNEGRKGGTAEVQTETAAPSSPSVLTPPPGAPMTDAQRNNAPFHDAYLRMQAEKRGETASGAQDQLNAQIRSERQAAIGDLGVAKREADVARFRSTDGADIVLAGGNPAYAAQRAGIIADAAGKKEHYEKLQQQAGNVTVPRDFAKEAQATTQAGQEERRLGVLEKEAAGRTGIEQQKVNILGATADVDIAGKKIGLAQQKQILDVGSRLAVAKTPEEANILSRQIAALLGKEHPNEWQGAHFAGSTYPDPTFPGAQIKAPDSFMLFNSRTGENHTFQGAGQPAAGAAQYRKGEQRTMNGITKELDGQNWITVQ